MSNIVKIEDNLPLLASDAAQSEQFLTVRLDGQIFGIPVLKVRDVLKPLDITCIPLSRPEIEGYMNLRGRIVTVIDVRKRLGLPPLAEDAKRMHVVVEDGEELYSLLVDKVGQARNMPNKAFEKNPVNLSETWKNASRGVFKMKDELMLILDINYLLDI